jgi:hypothetical protein
MSRGTLTNDELRTKFNQFIEAARADRSLREIARFEIAREYFTNEKFRDTLQVAARSDLHTRMIDILGVVEQCAAHTEVVSRDTTHTDGHNGEYS